MPATKLVLIEKELSKNNKTADEKLEFVKRILDSDNRPQMNSKEDLTKLKSVRDMLNRDDIANPDAYVYEIQQLLAK